MIEAVRGFGRRVWRLTAGNPVLLSVVVSAGRRPAQTWIRTGYLALLTVTALVLLGRAQTAAGVTLSRLGQAGEAMFTFIALLQLAVICVVSPVFAAGAIGREGDPKSRSVLCTTPLSSSQIILGGLLGRVGLIWALLLAGLPIMAVTKLFGRVSNEQIFLATGVSAATALLCGSVAVAWSNVASSGRRSLPAFYALIFGYLLVVPVLSQLPLFRLPSSAYAGQVTWLTPLHPMCLLSVLRALPWGKADDQSAMMPPAAEDVRRLGWGSPWDWYLSSPAEAYMVLAMLASLLLVVPAVVRFRSEAALSPARDERAGWGVRLGGLANLLWLHPARWTLGAVVPALGERWKARAAVAWEECRTGSRVLRVRNVWQNPIAWREAATSAGSSGRGAAKWALLLIGLAIAVQLAMMRIGAGSNPQQIDNVRAFFVTTVFAEFCLLPALVLNAAASAITREREGETLDLLLATPMTPRQFINGKLSGVMRFAAPLVFLPTAAVAAVWVGDWAAWLRTGKWAPTVFVEAALLLPVVFLVMGGLAGVLGLRLSLNNRRTAAAVFKGVLIAVPVLVVVHLIARAIGAATAGTVGTAVLAVSPVDAVLNLTNPFERFAGVLPQRGMFTGAYGEPSTIPVRLGMVLGTVLGAVAGGVVVAVLLNNLVTGWRASIRKMQT